MFGQHPVLMESFLLSDLWTCFSFIWDSLCFLCVIDNDILLERSLFSSKEKGLIVPDGAAAVPCHVVTMYSPVQKPLDVYVFIHHTVPSVKCLINPKLSGLTFDPTHGLQNSIPLAVKLSPACTIALCLHNEVLFCSVSDVQVCYFSSGLIVYTWFKCVCWVLVPSSGSWNGCSGASWILWYSVIVETCVTVAIVWESY